MLIFDNEVVVAKKQTRPRKRMNYRPFRVGNRMHKAATNSLPFLSIRIHFDSEGRIGPGKIELLESIRACGSISAAGRAMDMSYKRAWGLVNEIDRVCGQSAVKRIMGGKSGGGAVLTPFGLSLIDCYRKIERAASDTARKELQALRSDITKLPRH
jgi:molybdate transport system regulatory protein